MAETAVNFVLGKLTDAAVKKVLLLWGVEKQVEKIKQELIRIQAFLKDADRKKIRDERQKNWVKEIRNVAYKIEDAIDNALLLEDCAESEIPRGKTEISRSSCFPCRTNTIKKMFRKPGKLPALHKLGVEIDEILAEIKDINESKITYGTENLGEGSGELLRLPIGRTVFPDFDDPDVVGLDKDIDNIVGRLLDESTKSRSVVSIVGTGGLGKTTLARKAYNRSNIKSHFNSRAWVTVSKEFKPIDLLKKIVEQVESIDPSEHDKDIDYFYSRLNKCMKGKQYLLILDDVWTNQLWSYLNEALPDEENGSRVLITTRLLDVAKDADSRSEPYKLQYLDDESSIKLLLKKALPNHNTIKDYPNDLIGLAKEFAKKCGGLPLALKVLGGLLSKESKYSYWDTILRTISWSDKGRACTEVLSSSYEDLTLALKSCFMYFAIFPEDFEIDAKRLVRMWVAEGFIPIEENRELEDTAESFLEELVQRSMIQVESRSYFNGSTKYCRIHDLLRDLAIQEAKEDNFLTVYSNKNDQASYCTARRVAVHNSDCAELIENASPNLRSLLCFGPTPDCSKQRLLKVLRTEGIEFKWLERLTQLRYFEYNKWWSVIKYNNYKRRNLSEDQYFERFLCSRKFLQTLDLRSTEHGDLPDCIWQVKTLRHVILAVRAGMNTLGPPSGADLRNLQTLSGVKCRTSWAATASGIPNLPNLRELFIQCEGLRWDVMATLLGTLNHLKILELMTYDDDMDVPDMSGFPFYRSLQYLNLIGFPANKSPLHTNMFPIHLTELALHGLQLDHDPMGILEKLQNLEKLRISVMNNRRMRFSANGFVQLEQLSFYTMDNLEELEIEENAMPILKELMIGFCTQLCVPLGLRNLTSLKKLHWDMRPDKLAPTKSKELRNVCKNIPLLDITMR